jgi:hypothetical protein
MFAETLLYKFSYKKKIGKIGIAAMTQFTGTSSGFHI